ncbi:probable protein phosphatase 1N [Tiliqua scincoides]|uniref:probable protein phosphatase 1N n=1 Tax=Tiliqua scincoides TaxID=71010 RepID=UPI0034626B12
MKSPLFHAERKCGPSSEQGLGVVFARPTHKPSCTLALLSLAGESLRLVSTCVQLSKAQLLNSFASCQKILAGEPGQRTLGGSPKAPSGGCSSRASAKTASIRPSRIFRTFSLRVQEVLCGGRSPCPRMASFVRLLVSEVQRMLSQFWKAEQEAEAPTFFLEAPQTKKLLEQGEAGGLRFGLGSMQGWRAHMEDAHTTQLQLPGALAGWAFFAVYDGHAGSTVARFCAQHLLEHVLEAQALSSLEEDPEAVKEGVRQAFLAIDKRMQALSQAEAWERAGSTAVAVLVSPGHFYFINLGDSRALLCRSATVTFYTEDHKPSKPSERKRIENAGGTVTLERVNGSLAVSRALGDFDYKAVAWRGPTEQLVSPEPEVYELERCPAEDEFLVLACDGVWDTFDNTGLCAFVRSRLCLSGDPRDVCECVLDASLYKGSRDNMTCIMVCFPAAPGVSQEAWQKECELDAYLEKRVAEIFEELLQQERGPSLVGVFQCLATEVNPSLPPGGGLASKRAVIMEAYNRVKQRYEEQQQLLAPSAASASS